MNRPTTAVAGDPPWSWRSADLARSWRPDDGWSWTGVRRWLLLGALVALLVTGLVGTTGEPPVVAHVGDPPRVEDGTFRMTGELVVAGRGSLVTYRDVHVVLYDEDRSVVASVAVGTLSTDPGGVPRSRPVNVTSDVVPTYVVVRSDDFWRGGPVAVEGFVAREFERPSGPVVRYQSVTRRVPGEWFPEKS